MLPANLKIGKMTMSETFWDMWRGRFIGAWAVLIGRAYAAYYMTEAELMERMAADGLIPREEP